MEPSEVIGDRYELLQAIGRGGMATIYRAYDRRLSRMVAVKILREAFCADPKSVTRFQREALAASAVQYPNIVQVFAFGQSSGYYYIVMELIQGMDLRKYLNREGILSNERAIEIAHDVALGLGMAHRRGIVHRDVKPHNILLGTDGAIKLTDFGIASVYTSVADERLTASGTPIGTMEYCAPEQVRGQIVQPQADIYSLGAVMYEMATGQTPFAAAGSGTMAVAMQHVLDLPEPPRRFNPNMWPAFERLVLRCLEKDPPNRYPNGDALAYALEGVARVPGGRQAGARPSMSGGATTAGVPAVAPGVPQRGDIADQETTQLPPRRPTVTDLETEQLPPRHSTLADEKTRRLPS